MINGFLYRICLSDKTLRLFKHFVCILKDDKDGILRTDHYAVCHALKSGKIIILRSWNLNADELVTKHKLEICHYFRPRKNTRAEIENRFLGLRKEYDLLVGIHIRRTDYKTHLNGRFYYTDDTYLQMAKHLNGILNKRKVLFLLFSDEHINPGSFTSVSAQIFSSSAIKDLYSMAKCDFLMGPPSTFTFWASFYGDVPLYSLDDIKKLPQLKDFRIAKSGGGF